VKSVIKKEVRIDFSLAKEKSDYFQSAQFDRLETNRTAAYTPQT
jgi:hypothetical protein